MIRLRPWLRLYRTHEGARFLESVLEERALPLDDVLLDVIRALARSPASTGSEIAERAGRTKGEVHGALARLSGLNLVDVTNDENAAHAFPWKQLERGFVDVPVVDNIELTNICPMSCAMCPTGSGRMTRTKGKIAADTFGRVVDEIAPHKNHGKPLALHNLGESTLHPELVAFVRTAAARGLSTELSSNPGHMPLDLFRALDDAGLTRLILSVDGLDADTLTAIRGKGARAEVAFANLDAIAAAPSNTQVEVQLIRQKRNVAQADAFLARYAKKRAHFEAYVKELDANTVDDAGDIYEIGRPKRPYLCRAPWKSVVVLWNGDVVPCCHDANGAVVYGNVNEGSLRAVFAGARAAELRRSLVEGTTKSGEICHGCAHRADRYAVPPLDEIPVEPLHW